MTNHNFDAALYADAYPDVELSGLSPKDHYERYGKFLGRDPASRSSTSRSIIAATSTPELLDIQYSRGIIPNNSPLIHDELITVIMPSYNNEAWITRAINSVLSQRGVNIELVVVDDGSTDGSVSIAREIANTEKNMRVISLLRNFGCYYARNIGIMNARGEYVTVVDSDDIISPDRLQRQLTAIKSNVGAVGSRCQQRRWTSDYNKPLSGLKAGENSLLWRLDVVRNIGPYDTVKFSGDAEFRFRIQRTYGTTSIVNIPDELYFLRTLENSLTTGSLGRVYTYEDSNLKVNLSPERQAYLDAFTKWQKSTKPKHPEAKHRMKMDFPQLDRPFTLGAKAQNASPSLAQRRIGAMASFPPRLESLDASMASILPQLDELILYLNEYEDIPAFARHPKVRVIRSQDAAGDLRDNGKFYDLPTTDDAYVFTLDDDLIYPPDYVARMIHQIEMLDRSSVVGLHGVIFPPGEFSQLSERTVFHFGRKTPGHFVDLLGTGTTAWHSSTFKPTLEQFASKGVCDLWFASAAAAQAVPLYAVPRTDNWVREHSKFDQSLWREAVTQPQGYFDVYNQHVAPVLEKGLIRRRMEAHLARGYDADTLVAAGIELRELPQERTRALIPTRKPVDCRPTPYAPSSVAPEEPLHFHIVVNGWNCREYVDACLRSIAGQLPGPFTYEATLIDDGSTDGTFEALANASVLPDARIVRIAENAGPAHARHVGIRDIQDPEAIVVLVDMDDALERHALKVVAQSYLQNPHCLMTIGNWHDQDGKRNPQGFYSAQELDRQTIRDVDLFNATHLRTFRRKLYDAIQDEDLFDQNGRWLETCTDVGLMYPLLDQCWSDEVDFIHEPIYRYTRKHSTGTLARFGKPHKVERLAWLKAKPPKPRLRIHRHPLVSA